MSMIWLPLLRVFRKALLGSILTIAVGLSASEGGFTSSLSAEQKDAAGLSVLTSEENTALDRYVAAEVSQARMENSIELEGTFVARRTDEERRLAGLDHLTSSQLTKLNGLVASVVVAGPKPKERPRIKDSEVFTAQKKPEVHGEFSLTYGRSSGGGEIRGASMWVDYLDPNSGLSLGVGISRFSGKGLYGFCPGYDGTASLYGSGIGFDRSPYRGFASDYLPEPDGATLGLSYDVNSPYYRGFRRR